MHTAVAHHTSRPPVPVQYGGSGSWYYATLAGLQRAPGSRSWRELVIAPPAPGTLSNLTWANASIDTPMGLVSSAWSARRGQYTLHAIIPPNARARITMPTVNGMLNTQTTVSESGAVVWSGSAHAPGAVKNGIRSASAGTDGRSVLFTVGSGSFSFVASEEKEEGELFAL